MLNPTAQLLLDKKIVNNGLFEENKEISEYDICQSLIDPVYFIENFCKIEVTSKGLQPFRLFNYQKISLRLYLKGINVKIKKGRQAGFTTMASAFALWRALRGGNNILLLSKGEIYSQDILRKIKIMYDNLPEPLKIPIVSYNQQEIEFENKNRIKSLPASERSGAGLTASLIILDEFSGFRGKSGEIIGENIWSAIVPTISTGGQVIVQSTPKGTGNMFYQIMERDNDDFIKIETDWRARPDYCINLRLIDEERRKQGWGDYTSDWAEKMMKTMTLEGWQEEFLGSYLQSGRPVFNQYDIDKAFQSRHEVDKVDTQSRHYFIGVDLASGTANDYSVSQLISTKKIQSRHEVDKVDTIFIQEKCHRTKTPLDIFGKEVRQIAIEHNMARIAFENNSGYGLSFMNNIKDYPNLYRQTKIINGKKVQTDKLGWTTSRQSKELMIYELNLLFTHGKIILTDKQTVEELKSYQYQEDGSMNAPAGSWDDTVTSLAIAIQCAKDSEIILNDTALFEDDNTDKLINCTISFGEGKYITIIEDLLLVWDGFKVIEYSKTVNHKLFAQKYSLDNSQILTNNKSYADLNEIVYYDGNSKSIDTRTSEEINRNVPKNSYSDIRSQLYSMLKDYGNNDMINLSNLLEYKEIIREEYNSILTKDGNMDLKATINILGRFPQFLEAITMRLFFVINSEEVMPEMTDSEIYMRRNRNNSAGLVGIL